MVSPTQAFIYDALYRLIEANGRELIGTATFGASDNWNDSAWQTTHKGNGNAVQNYTQKYTYDAVGNILELRHIAAAGSYTRTYDIATDSNRLLHTTVGRIPPDEDTYSYTHDVRGNMTEMPHLDAMHWNLNNELHQIANGTMEAYYQYSGGQRIRKYVDKGSIKEERIYLGSFEIYRKFDHTSSLAIERTTVHVSDDTGRIAMLETRTVGDAINDHGTAEELVRYIYSNHLQSASLELDESGAIISYEEYHPYGTTSYQAMNASIHAVAKRYRYTGKERDEESGLYYHGARYYIPWLCRWSAVDALQSEMPTWSPYNYGFCNPVIFNDPSGNNPEDPPKIGDIREVNGRTEKYVATVEDPTKGEWMWTSEMEEVVMTGSKSKPVKSEYLGRFINLGSFGNGLIDGFIGALPELGKFIWGLITSSDARQAFFDGIKQLASDPFGVLGDMLQEKWDLYSAVLSGSGTEAQKYEVGKELGDMLFFSLASGGTAVLTSKLIKLKKLEKNSKRIDKLEKNSKRIDYDNYGSESLDVESMWEVRANEARMKRKAAYDKYSGVWAEANFDDALTQFADGIEGIVSPDGVKTRFLNPDTKIELILDNENNYFRIFDYNRNQYIDMSGKVPATGKLSGSDAKNFIKAQTHFKNIR